jgi:hypothetical protein
VIGPRRSSSSIGSVEVVDLSAVRPNVHARTLGETAEFPRNQLPIPVLREHREARVATGGHMATSSGNSTRSGRAIGQILLVRFTRTKISLPHSLPKSRSDD